MSVMTWQQVLELRRLEQVTRAQEMARQIEAERHQRMLSWLAFGCSLVSMRRARVKVLVPRSLGHPDLARGFRRSAGLDSDAGWRMELPAGRGLHVEVGEHGRLVAHWDRAHFAWDRPETYEPHLRLDVLPELRDRLLRPAKPATTLPRRRQLRPPPPRRSRPLLLRR